MKKIGLIVNPFAGIGGKVGLKGSDGTDIRSLALAMGARPEAVEKALKALEKLVPLREEIEVWAAPGEMGERIAKEAGFTVRVCAYRKENAGGDTHDTDARDTEGAARIMVQKKVDLLLFAGGDGTARDVCGIVGNAVPALGIPAGVKIHSAVYANTPQSAGEAAARFLRAPQGTMEAEVMDIDETAFRENIVQTQLYGYLRVPAFRALIQHAKAGGGTRSVSSSVNLLEIAAEIAENMREGVCYIIGTDSTTYAVTRRLGLDGTLLGVDVVLDKKLVLKDTSEEALLMFLKQHKGPSQIVVTVIGGQGHVFGRGNQQLSPRVIRTVGLQNILVAAEKEKLFNLPEQSLVVDTGEAELDAELRGYRPVLVGQREKLVLRVR